ncbi:ribonuclease H-like domain-containing protein [Tanacetum coccineum]
MLDEYNTLITNGTWVLVPYPANVNVVRSMWLFKHKFNADGLLSKYKARLVANGHNQHQGIDCDETFCLVVKPATIRTVLSLAVSRDWPIHQLDVKNVFLHGHLSETVYMHQPPSALLVMLHESVFSIVKLTPLYLSFIEDLILLICCFMWMILFLQHHLQHFYSGSLLPSTDGDPVSDPTLYRSLDGALQYLTFTHPDLSHAIQQVCLYMHDPRDPHFTALKRILRYVRGTLDYGLQLHVS